MFSQEFDYEKLKAESEHFAIKQYRDSIYKGEIQEKHIPETNKTKKLRHGKGVIIYANGRIFEGDWVDDQRCGHGSEYFSNGN